MKSKSYWKRVNSYSHHLLQAFETDNQMLVAAATAVHQARLAEDAAYRRFSGKDFSSDDLKAAYPNLNWKEGKLLNHAPTAESQKWVKHQKYI